MGRVIRLQNGTQIRSQAMKMLSYLVRYLASAKTAEAERVEIIMYMAEQLEAIRISVDQSATAWEKRDYWLKADQFRRQWTWVEKIKGELATSLEKKTWTDLPEILANLAGRLGSIEPPKRLTNTSPWKKTPAI